MVADALAPCAPGHQQPWYWLCRIGRSLSYSGRNFNYRCLISVKEWHKMSIYVYVLSEKIAHKGLRTHWTCLWVLCMTENAQWGLKYVCFRLIMLNNHHTVETLYNTINFCWSTHKRHSIARPKGRGMGCLLWVQRATYCVDLSILSSIKYLL